MPKPYSYDLRQKVIQAIELDGMNKSEAAEVFQISRKTKLKVAELPAGTEKLVKL